MNVFIQSMADSMSGADICWIYPMGIGVRGELEYGTLNLKWLITIAKQGEYENETSILEC